MSDNMVRGLAVVWCLSLYCIPLMILGAIVEWWIERKDRKAAERSERNKRRREREIQLAGYRLTNADERYRILHEPPRCEREPERKSPVRKVCGVFAESEEARELWA